jgi:hypothetical protein
MNTDILANIIGENDLNLINSMQLIKSVMEHVEKLENTASGEKKLIVINVLQDFIKYYDNTLSIDIKNLLESDIITHIIEAFIFTSKTKIDINNKKKVRKCFIF